jgi:threonine dehydratase
MASPPATAARRRQVRPPGPDEQRAAAAVVAAHLRPTPLVPVRLPGVDGEVLVKLESVQPTGSFKVRGALAAVAAYGAAGPASPGAAGSGGAPAARVVTASAGNHGLGVAFAGDRLGVPATVVVPTTASVAKVEALGRFAIDLVQHGDDYEQAEAHALALADEVGGVFVSAYNDAHVMAGQATMAAEVMDQAGEDVTLLVPVSGGGLLAGSALAAAGHPGLTVVGVEASTSPALSAAIAAGGSPVTVPVSPSLADGLSGNLEPGSVTPAIAAPGIAGIVGVDEDAIAGAMRTLVTHAGLVAEGAAAVGFAALMAGIVPLAGRPVVALTGRNVAPALLARVLAGDGGAP